MVEVVRTNFAPIFSDFLPVIIQRLSLSALDSLSSSSLSTDKDGVISGRRDFRFILTTHVLMEVFTVAGPVPLQPSGPFGANGSCNGAH